MKKIDIGNISKEEIYMLEKDAELISKKIEYKYKIFFENKGYSLRILFRRIRESSSKFPFSYKVSHEECFDLFYQSSLGIYVYDAEGTWLVFYEDEDDNPVSLEIPLWKVDKSFLCFTTENFLGKVKHYITELTIREIEEELVAHIKYIANKFRIPLC